MIDVEQNKRALEDHISDLQMQLSDRHLRGIKDPELRAERIAELELMLRDAKHRLKRL